MSDSTDSWSRINRTLILSLIITLLMYSLAFFFAVSSQNTIESTSFAPDFLSDLYGIEGFNLGLTVIMIAILSIGFFFSVIAWATVVERNHGIPGWKEIFLPLLINLAVAGLLINLNVGTGGLSDEHVQEGGTNFTSAMKYSVFLITLVMNTLFIFYIANTAPDSED
ncbi:MAG: hypothetical protein ACTSYA_11980 [Candidatus Kariarchaeaceae archaeon]